MYSMQFVTVATLRLHSTTTGNKYAFRNFHLHCIILFQCFLLFYAAILLINALLEDFTRK